MKTGHQDIARRYARAFFELAQAQGQIEQIFLDFQSLQGMLAESDDFTKFIGNVTMPSDKQVQVLGVLGSRVKLGPLTQKFLGTLATNRRLNVLPEIIAAVQSRIAAHKGEVTAEITAAYALDAAQVAAISAALKKVLGVTVKLKLKQNAEIMGGLIIKIGSRQIDSSVQAKLQRLHRALKNPNTSSDKSKTREVA
jgi:F-type H+-transporting ATPase subunit delta